MDHGEMKKKIFEFYDGELDPQSRPEIESHLLDCAECREVFARWKKTSKAFFPKADALPSEFFVQCVMTRLKAAEEVQRPVEWRIALRWLVPALGLAAMFFLVMVPEPNPPLSLEAFLNHPQDAGASVLSGKVLTTNETLEFVMEG